MFNLNAHLKAKTNGFFSINNEYIKRKQDEYFYNNKNKKESNNVSSPNIIEISSLNQYKEYIDPLNNDENSEFSRLILSSTIKNIMPLEEREEDENENILNIKKRDYNNKSISKFIVNKIYKKKIFKIKKILKLGRIKKNSNKKGKHDKFQRDNVIRRFKVFLMRNIYNYLNNSFIVNVNKDENNKINILQRISSFNSKSISKKENIKWFYSKIKDVFSENLKKFVCFDLDYNKKKINKVIQEGKEKKTIYILNKTIKEMWFVYINDDKSNDFVGFKTIKDDIIKLRKNGETEAYIALYVKTAKDFENIFNEINPRISKKKNNYLNV